MMEITNGAFYFRQEKKRELKIFAIDKDGDEFEITDLYWFEEQMIHDFIDPLDRYKFRIEVYAPAFTGIE